MYKICIKYIHIMYKIHIRDLNISIEKKFENVKRNI